MPFFFWGITILFAATAIYYVIFFAFVYYWHERKETFIVVPLIYASEFFIIGFLVVSLVSLILYYLPEAIKLFAAG